MARKPRDSPTLVGSQYKRKTLAESKERPTVEGVIIGVPHVKVDFANVSTIEALPAGEYECLFSLGKEAVKASASGGQPTLYVEYLVKDTNQKIFKSYSLQAKALWALKRDLIRVGADLEAMNSEEADLDEIVEGLVGYSCTVICGEPHWYPANEDGTPKGDDSKLQTTFKEVKDPTKL